MLCRFYGFGLDDVMKLTIRQFIILSREISVIMQMEYGGASTQQGSLTGAAAHKVAMRMFRRGKK